MINKKLLIQALSTCVNSVACNDCPYQTGSKKLDCIVHTQEDALELLISEGRPERAQYADILDVETASAAEVCWYHPKKRGRTGTIKPCHVVLEGGNGVTIQFFGEPDLRCSRWDVGKAFLLWDAYPSVEARAYVRKRTKLAAMLEETEEGEDDD